MCELQTGRQDGPVDSRCFRCAGDSLNGGNKLWMVPLCRYSKRLCQVRGPDKKHIDTRNGRNCLDFLDSIGTLNLNGDECLGVGSLHIFGHWHGAEAAVDAATI